MFTRLSWALLSIAVLCCWNDTGRGQPVPTASSLVSTATASGELSLEAIATSKVAVQGRLKAIEQTQSPASDVTTTRAALSELFTTLTALEEAVQQRAAFLALLEAAP